MKGILFIITVVSLFCSKGYAQVNVSANRTAQALAQKLAGQGVTILNPTLHCAGRANGFFNTVSSNLGLDSGIVLTNGCAATQSGYYGINGPSSFFASNNNGMPGDTMLTPLAGRNTYDACVLELDVIPGGDTIKFNYVFSSEEYTSAVCGSYNDVFGFFISGPGITGYDNMALVPGTNIPVTINTINNGIPGSSGSLANCTAMGPGSPFTAYYVDNSSGGTLTHLGLTKVLQAKHWVVPCSSYHLKLAIADAGNATYDSGVFLEAGSLATGSYSIKAVTRQGTDTTVAYCVRGCVPGRFVVRRTRADTKPQTIRFITGGDAVSGVDYSAIADSVVIPANSTSAEVVINGLPTAAHDIKTLRLFILSAVPCSGVNNISDSASIVIYDTIHTTAGINDVAICMKDSTQLSVNGDDIFSYDWSPTEGLSNAAIKDPIAFPPVSTVYTVTVSLPGTTCRVKQQEVGVRIKLTPVVVLKADTAVCRNTRLRLETGTIEGNAHYSYSWSGPSGFTSTFPDLVVQVADSANAGRYAITVANDTNGCTGRAMTDVSVIIPPKPVVSPPRIYCRNRYGEALKAAGDTLLWYLPSADTAIAYAPVPDTREIGEYRYYVSQVVGGCESRKAELDVTVEECCNGVIIIPSAFTPNNDGRNDVFRAVTGYGYRFERFIIYDRWGQEVYSGLDGVWDGKVHGADAEIGTYFYSIMLNCILGGREVRQGDVTLIR